MLKVIDYLKKGRSNSETFEGAQHVKQITSQRKTLRFKRSDDNPELPENFKVGQAIGGGDCFFDSVAKGLKQLKPDMEFTVKSLRKVCKDLAVGNQQLKSKIIRDARNRHDLAIVIPDDSVSDDELWDAYLASIEYTSDDINKMQVDNPSLYQSLTSLKYGNTLQVPIWGRPDIEGQMICKKYNVKLHVVEKHVMEGKELWLDQIVNSEGSRSVDSIDYNEENTIHIINRGNAHFEPILGTQGIQYNKQQSPDSSDYDDEITPEEELINIIKSRDSEEEKLQKIRGLFAREPELNINFQEDKNEDTSLHIAVRKKELKVIEWLVKNGAKIDIKNSRGRTSLDITEKRDTPNGQDIVQILKSHIQQVSVEEQPAKQERPSEENKLEDSDQKNQRSEQERRILYSDKLPFDKDLKLSNGNFKSIIESDIKHVELNTADKLNFLNRPAYPDEYLLVHFASRVYKEREDGQELPDRKLPEGWKLLTTAYNQGATNHYFGAAYWNPDQQQIVIAHRGTDPSSTGALWTDIRGILQNNYVPQMNSAVTFANKIKTVLDEFNKKPNVNLQLSFTGHSLGGWLAQITTFTTKYFILEPFNESSFFVKSEKMGYHAHTVAFDSPGSKDMLSKIKSDFDLRHYKDDNSLSLSYLDITSYLSAPNLVNTCCSHLGTIYRVFIENLPHERSSWDFAKYTKETHSIVKIEEALDPEKGNELKAVIDWPLVKKGITRRALEKLLSSSHGILGVLRRVVFNQGESEQLPERNEYEYFHKLARDVSDYNPEPDDKEGYCTVRYQVQDVNKKKCSTRIFTQPELEFLRDYQKLRQFLTSPQLQGLFSSFNNENTVKKAIEALKNFKVEDRKKTVHCQSEKELNELITYVKNALYFFPDIKSKTKNVQTRKPIWFDVEDLVRPFTALTPGRQEKLEQIASSIQEGIVVISGLVGVGKSELAVKYARSQYSQEDSVIWINAETRETAKDSFHRLHKKLGLKIKDEDGEEKSIELVIEEIYKHLNDGKRLFIFDNAEKYSTIEKFLPLGLPDNANKPYVLITSPNNLEWKSARVNIGTLSLGDFTDAEAIEFVKTALKIGDDSQNVDIINLVKRLHNFPLALQHAVTYIKDASEEFQARGSEFKASDYLEKYEQEPKKMLSIKSIDDEHTEAIFKALKITIDKIRDNKEYGQQALDMLNIVSYFMSRNIPEKTFLNELASGDQEKLISITRLLRKYSIVNLEQGMLNVHGLVQQIRRLELGDQQEEGKSLEEKTLERALWLLKEYVKAYPGNAASCIPHIISIWDYASKYDELIKSFIIDSANNKATTSTTYFDLIIEGSNYEVIDAIIKKISSDNLKEVINAKNKDDVTPLHKAVLRNDEKIVKRMIDEGADVNAKKSNDWTPLHLAAKNGNLEIVNALLGKGANVDDKTSSKYQFTPLHLAARNGHKEVVEALLAKNANINARTGYEFTPLHLAADNDRLDVVQTLLKNNQIIINAETKDKFTPLHLAAKSGHLSVIEALLAKSADINAQNKDGFTPLHLAALNGHAKIVNKLVKNYKVDIDARTTNGNTPLHLAAEKGHLEIVKALIAKNADIDIKNGDGNTASDLAHSEVKDCISSIYKRTKGAAGIEGQLCEINLSMLLLLKGVTDERIGGFHLASNMEKADKFDDIVFKYEYKGEIIEKSKIIFLQAKHKTDQKGVNINSLLSDSESGDFSLKKYFISYRKIKQQFSETKGPVFGSKFEDSEFIIYTNALFVKADGIKEGNIDQNDFLRISDSQSKYYQLEFNGNKKERIVNLLKDSSDSRRLAKELVQSISSGKGIDMQKDIFQSYHTALQGKVIEKIDDKLEGKLSDNFLSDGGSLSSGDKEFRRVFLEEAGKVFKKQGSELKQELQNKVIKLSNKFGINSDSENLELPNDDPIAEDEIKDFLNKFKLFASQPSEKDLEKVIKDKVKEVYKVEQQDIDSVFSDVEYRVKKWWQSGNNYLKKDNKFFEDAARVSINFDVKEPVTLFTGRIRELEDLHKILQEGGEAVISQMASVTGLGGIGKSELARKYISEHNKDYDNNVIWINADNYLTIAESFRRLAQDKLRISTLDENGKEKEIKLIVEDVYRFFAKRHRRSLFVFDNAGKHKVVGEGEGVDKFLPSAPNKPHVLITSRDQEWGEIKSLSLGVFTEEEAVEFIRKALKIEDGSQESEIKNLAETLHRLPLALQQAVAYINKENQGKWSNEKFTISNYLELYKGKANELLNKGSGETYDRYTETVMTTWQITIDKIKQKKVRGGEQALEILDIMAYLAPDKIPVDEIFSKLIGDDEVRHSAVELLDQYSMASLEGGKLNIHRLVQQVTRIELEERNKEREVLRKALTLLKNPMEEEGNLGNKCVSHAISAWSYTSEYNELVKEFSRLPSQVVNKLDVAARYEEACIFGVKASELLKSILGPEHQSTLIIQNNLALVLHKQGKYDEALEIYGEIYKILEHTLGPNHPNTLTVRNNVAGILSKQGKYDEALEIYGEIYKILEHTLGPNHPNTLTVRNNVAEIFYKQSKYDEALEIYGEIYEILKHTLRPNHLDTLTVMNNIAGVFHKQGKYEEALQIYNKVYERRKDILGSDHPDTLTVWNNVAGILDDQGKYDEALQIYNKVYERRKDILGSDHPDALITRNSMAEVLHKQGKYEEALQIYNEVHKRRKEILGPEHPSTLTTENNVAGVLHEQGKYEEALEIYGEIYKILEHTLGPNHPNTLTVRNNVAGILSKQGKYDEALEIYGEIYKILEHTLGPNHPNTLTVRNNVAGILSKQGKYDEALEIYGEIYKILEHTLGPNHPDTLTVRNNVAGVLHEQGKYEEALQIYNEVHKRRKEILGPEHPSTLTTENNIAGVFHKQGKYDEALEIYGEIYKILEHTLGPNHPNTLTVRNNVAGILSKQGKYEKALQAYQEVFDKRERTLGPDHHDTLQARNNIAEVFYQQGKYDEALQIYNEIYKKSEDALGSGHQNTLIIQNNMALVLFDQGQYEKALAAFQEVYNKFTQMLGPDHPYTLQIRNNIIAVLHAKDSGLTPLHLAAKEDRLDAVKYLIDEKNADFNAKDNYGRTPLHLATQSGNLKTVEYVLEKGADILARNNHDTVLHQAVSSSNEEVVRLILEKIREKFNRDPQQMYKSINAQDTEGDTPLMWATKNGKTNAAKILLEYGADLNAKNNDGETALHWAAKGGYQELVQLLLNKQADPNIQDNNGKTPLDLAKEKLTQDPKNDDLQTIVGLLLSVTDKSQYREEQTLGSVSAEECLPSTSSGRSKREAKVGECEFSWEDVDEFNEEKDEKRDLGKIKIDSEKFVSYIKDLPEEKQSQLIQLADKVKVTGESQSLVNKLIGDQKVMNHLARVGRISGITMHGMMAKNVLADFLNGDYQGVAINVGFIAGGQGFAKVAEAASLKGLKLASEGKLLLSSSLRAASPFLARGTSAFVIYDLVNQVKAFKNGTEEALVGIVGDSIYLGVDAAEIGIEIAEAFEVLEGVSSVTGPIGTAIGAVVFVGTDVYMAVKRVDKIDQIIHLKGNERFIEGLRAFIGMQPEKHIEELIEEKQLNNQLVKQGLEYLQQHSNIQRYVFPTGKSVVDSCNKVQQSKRVCVSPGFNGCTRARTVTSYTEKCTTKFEEDLDNTVLLDRRRTDIKWSRAKPDNPRGGQLFCLPQGNYEPVPNYGSYLCKSAIGITDLSTNKTGGYTLINLGEGTDHAKGFIDSPNIFVVNNGSKKYHGGNKDDIFILQGSSITGYFYGEGGVNTLDLTSFAPEKESIDVKLHVGQVEDYYQDNSFGMSGINRFLGRKGKADRMFITCDSSTSDIKFVDGQGSSERFVDHIKIDDKDCAYEMQIVVRPNTVVYNRALKGDFHYIVPYALGNAKIDFIYTAGALNLSNTFAFEYEPAQIKNVDVRNMNVLNKTSHIITFNFSPMSGKEFNITISGASNPSYRLGNNTEIKVGNRGNLYMLENTNKSVNEIIKDYLVVANRLNKMSFFIQSLLSNETVAIGSGNYEVIHNNPLQKSHLVGNGGENVYVIDSENKRFEIPLPEVVIYDLDVESSVDTVDLRNLVQQTKGEFSNSFKLQILKSANDLLLKATVEKSIEDSSISEKHEYFTVRLKDGVNWYNKTHVIMDNVPMRINLDNNEWSLKPLPLVFEKDKEVIIVTSQDVEENTELITPKKAGNYTFVRDHGSDLIITNAFNTQDDLCTIVLSKFYETPKMKTLSIKFADKEIVLKDKQKEINTARYVDVVKREHKEQVYSDVFNHTKSSPEVIMLSGQPVTHRHEHHIRNRRSENTISSGTRTSSWINDLFGWVKSSVGGLFYSRAALPEETSSTTSSISQVDAKMDINGTIMLFDLLIRKVTGQKYISTVDQSIPLLEARGYALNITNRFEKVLNKTAIKSGISVTNLNFDPVAVQSAIIGKIINGRFSEIAKTLYSFAKEACPEFKQTDKFLDHLRSNLKEEKETVMLQQKVEKPYKDLSQEVSRKVELSKKPDTFLNGTSVVRGISRGIN